MANLKDFAEQLVNLSVKDVNELANILKEEYGLNQRQQQLRLQDRQLQLVEQIGEEKTEFDII